jgi:hypothetical protein
MWRRLSGNYLLRNASITATLAAAGAVTGLVLAAIIVYTFGADYHTDALFAAMTTPTLLTGVFSIQSPKAQRRTGKHGGRRGARIDHPSRLRLTLHESSVTTDTSIKGRSCPLSLHRGSVVKRAGRAK